MSLPVSPLAEGYRHKFIYNAVGEWLPLEAAPFLTYPRKRGQGLVGQDKLTVQQIPVARANPCPRLRGKVRKGAASSGTLSKPYLKSFSS